ncbi:Pr6Pr family membrane protein [Isobaculum melis]|uniref:Pr6Pr family membrane protein n=1 Tax=Isobaculum melis TaxID=142588 RepID=A0A1H9PRA4_9LACT|nr:Pr6Pr family membrane protein [Isobaculum melis]SER50724.1 hypothetical protein SAMN04488559_10186 [Isobaculum melis]
MIDKTTKISLSYKIIFSILLITGILARAGLLGGKLQLQTFYSFTSISNIYILMLTFIAILSFFTDKELTSKGRLIGVVMILTTGIIYHFILLPEKIIENPHYQVFTYGNIIAHYFAPCAMLLDWLLFDGKGKIPRKEPLICVSIPIVYFSITSLYSYTSSLVTGKEANYVYFFMDFDQLGIDGVFKWCTFILLAFIALVYTIYFLDYSIGRIVESNKPTKLS